MNISTIVIHCAATANGKYIPKAAETVDSWHAKRGFCRSSAWVARFNPHLLHIGYHFVINTDGKVETGRAVGEVGAHVKGHNTGSLGICLVGGVGVGAEKAHGRYTKAQWDALFALVSELRGQFPQARICGHRDLSPDLNGDGSITPNEWLKTCPNFDVSAWLKLGRAVFDAHLFQE